MNLLCYCPCHLQITPVFVVRVSLIASHLLDVAEKFGSLNKLANDALHLGAIHVQLARHCLHALLEPLRVLANLLGDVDLLETLHPPLLANFGS